MPPLVSHLVDQTAAKLLHDWIRGMEPPEQTFVRDWKVDDLAPSLDKLNANRAFAAGKTAFVTTGCVQCHRFQGEGGGAGPSLSGVGKRLQPLELLEAIVDPSKKVLPEFAATLIQTTDGRIVEGRIERESDSHIIVRTAESFATPTTILKAHIEQRAISQRSSMPSRMLNSLTEHQVLDLFAYLLTDGQPEHAAFASTPDTE